METGKRKSGSERPGPMSASGGSYPAPVERLVAEFARLPGIGKRSAERLAFHILKASTQEAAQLSRAIDDVKRQVRHCSVCFNFTDEQPCPICADPRRDASVILVVEQPKDLIALEFTGMFRGVYHVLMGRISPLESVGPSDLTIADLLRRVDQASANSRNVPVAEVILGMNPTLEGDGTALYLADQCRTRGVKVSRLARGLPAGGSLDLANKAVLADAIEGRRAM